jgi:hypothetical protein
MKALTEIVMGLLTAAVVLLSAAVLVTTEAYAQITPSPSLNATTTTNNATNATTSTNATTTTRIITNLTWFGGTIAGDASGPVDEVVVPLSPQNIEYQRTDPAFAKLAQVTSDCLNQYNEILKRPGGEAAWTAEDINGQDLCTDVIRQGIAQFCESTDFATFDMQKCEEARNMSEQYVEVAEIIFG